MKHTPRKFSSASPPNMQTYGAASQEQGSALPLDVKNIGAATQKFIVSLVIAAAMLCRLPPP